MANTNVSQVTQSPKHASGERGIYKLFSTGKKAQGSAKVVATNETFCHHSAAVHLYDIDSGIIAADYSGPITQTCLDSLSVQADLVTQHAKVKIVRLDKALLLFDQPITPLSSYAANEPPGCFVVRLDQLAAVLEFARELAHVGVLRTVFVAGQDERMAQEWVQAVAG